ncbi:MAG: phosphatidylserine/phosphatidylglycerophosphate/cardiolipin synthase family protein [Solobacterium sp.]|nr:phosphatidylserine/phosphatidylglycerophosphate/cardiolipin synthase family protein [Solobacterium sp.]
MKKPDYVLLRNGKNAFPEIIQCIRNAKESILIVMFIWRGDHIGHILAQEVLDAADRGVKVEIIKDRYGVLFELSEEDQTAMLHDEISIIETFKILGMEMFYHPSQFNKHHIQKDALFQKMKAHPNITILNNKTLYDHSKIYIFDNKIMIFGGINIEDKENGKDKENRFYKDLMVKTDDERLIRQYLDVTGGFDQELPAVVYNRYSPKKHFDIKEMYLQMLMQAKEKIFIMMPYLSPVKEITDELIKALDRNVTLEILVPVRSNLSSDLNKSVIAELYSYANEHEKKIHVFFTNDMSHTKLVCTDQMISFGSANMTRKAFELLGETNILIRNDDSPLAKSVREFIQDEKNNATEIQGNKDLTYSSLRVFIERLFT